MKKNKFKKGIKKLNKENDILQDFVLNQGLEIISKDDEIDKQNIEIVDLLDKIHDLKEEKQVLENENNNFKDKDYMYLCYLKAVNEKLKIKKIYKKAYADQNNKIKTLMEIIDSEKEFKKNPEVEFLQNEIENRDKTIKAMEEYLKEFKQKVKDLVDQSYLFEFSGESVQSLRIPLAKLIE